MLEYGGEYFNLKNFPDGEAKTELMRVMNKMVGKKFNGDPGSVEKREKEKRKVVASDPKEGRRPVAGPSTTYTMTYQ